MNSFKSIDYFKKVPSKYQRSTLIGGLLSLVAVFLMIFLLIEELYYFLYAPITRK